MSENVAKLRAEREAVLQKIEVLRQKAKEISETIRKAEGPIPDRSHRARGTGFSIRPANPAE